VISRFVMCRVEKGCVVNRGDVVYTTKRFTLHAHVASTRGLADPQCPDPLGEAVYGGTSPDLIKVRLFSADEVRRHMAGKKPYRHPLKAENDLDELLHDLDRTIQSINGEDP